MRYFQVQAQFGKMTVTFEGHYPSEDAALAFINQIRKQEPQYLIVEMDASVVDTTVVVLEEQAKRKPRRKSR